MKIQKDVANLLNILNAMGEALRLDAKGKQYNGKELYDLKFKIGFEDKEATLFCCANYYNAFDGAVRNLVCAAIEELGVGDEEPYESLYSQYIKQI